MLCEEFMDWVDMAKPEDLKHPDEKISLHMRECRECRAYFKASTLLIDEEAEEEKTELWSKFCGKLEKRRKKRNLGFRLGAGFAAMAAALLIAVLPISLNRSDESSQKSVAQAYLSKVNSPETDSLTMVDEIYSISTNVSEQDNDAKPDALDYYYALAN